MAFDPEKSADRTALNSEIDNDPESLGYASAANTKAILALLHDRSASGADSVANFGARAILRSIDTTDLVAMSLAWERYRSLLAAFNSGIPAVTTDILNAAEPSYPPPEVTLAYTSLLLQGEEMGISTDGAEEEGIANRRISFRNLWPNGGGFETRNDLNSETIVPSRAEVLFGLHTKISRDQYLAARNF